MRRRARRGGGRQVELEIESLGARGDGVARFEGRPVFLPLALPGDRVLARLTGEHAGGYRAEAIELLDGGPGRVAPPCPHFGPCGGCSLQHLADDRYAAWKEDLLRRALARRGLDEVPVRPLVRIPPGSRRRASFAAECRGDAVHLGFHERRSHAIVDLATCLLVTDPLRALLAPLRTALGALLETGERAEVAATETESGLDVVIAGRREPGLDARRALAAFAEAADLARLSWRPSGPGGTLEAPEPVALRRPPRVVFAGIPVEPPAGAFLQPTAAGEAVLVERVFGYLPEGAERIADLYAGCGTFSFPLARQGDGRARVHAVEGDSAALAALAAAARKAELAGRITVETRDLARTPVTAEELDGGDAVVFDPPRLGAKEQARALAGSSVPVVVAVSCNPSSFARDARILVDGGYRLEEVAPLDQFPWSGHLEMVARFAR